MKKLNFKTEFKFKLTIVSLSILMFIGVLSYQFTNENFYIVSTIIGFLSIIVIVLSIIGFIRSIKKLKKTKSKKKITPLVLISLIACLLLYIITENLFEAIKLIV